MPERRAQERLKAWQAARSAEDGTVEGSPQRRRAQAASRRARWAYEDAARAADEVRGVAPESFDESMGRALFRLQESSDGAAEITGGRRANTAKPETTDQRDKRRADEDEIARELDE